MQPIIPESQNNFSTIDISKTDKIIIITIMIINKYLELCYDF